MQLSSVMQGITWEFNKQQIKNSANSLPPGFEKFFFPDSRKTHKSNFHYVWGFNIRSPDSHLAIPSNLHRFMITPFIRIRSIPTIIVWLKQFSFMLLCSTNVAERDYIFYFSMSRAKRPETAECVGWVEINANFWNISSSKCWIQNLIKRNLLLRIVE